MIHMAIWVGFVDEEGWVHCAESWVWDACGVSIG